MQFFDGVAALLPNTDAALADYRDQLSLTQACPGLNTPRSAFVEQINHTDLLREISLGKKVVFVDTREQAEFDEIHLPGAHWLPLREVNADSVAQLQNADLIVPYCIKDFRGFEVAKSIKQQLDRQQEKIESSPIRVATLSPNGLKGWLNAQLPTVQDNNGEDNAQAALLHCAMEPQKCLKASQP